MFKQSILVVSLVWLSLVSAGVLPAGDSAAAVQQTFYVSPNGDDGNPGTESKPFLTIYKAQEAVRKINEKMTGDIVVMLRGGTYRLEKTFLLEAQDSGSGGHNVIYKSQPGETAVLSGGRAIGGWKEDAKGRWKAAVDIDNFRQLYVDGQRAVRARGDAPAGLKLAGDDGYTTTDAAVADWRNPADVEFCYCVIWAHTRCKVAGVRREGDHAVVTMLQPHFGNAKAKEGVNIANAGQVSLVYVENAFELLDEPGEWYLDRAADTVYYLPKPGQDMAKAEVVAPVLEKLVELRGTLDAPVQNIRFEGITFAEAGWLSPSRIGLVDLQANFALDWKNPYRRSSGLTAVHNQVIKSPANVVCRAARSIGFERCTFTRLGGAGVDLECGARDNVIFGCRFCDISGSAIQVGDVLKDDHHPDDPRRIVKNNAVVNNYIHDCCAEYWGGVGVFAGYTEGTVIAHNEICGLPYSGVSVGWGWGEEDAGGGNPGYQQPFKYETPTTAKDSRVEYNHIHDAMSRMDDGAGVYTLGNQPGTIIRGNHIHDCKNTASKRGWSQGIYLDEGSGFIEVVGNLVYRLKPTHFNNHCQNRLATCKVHDNFFDAKPEQLPEPAKAVASQAGLEPEYRDLLKKR